MLRSMNRSKRISIISLVILAILGACGTLPAESTPPTVSTSTTVIQTSTVLPIYTPFPNITAFALPTLGEAPPVTLQPTQVPLPGSLPISTVSENIPFHNLRMAYIVDGNLYVQDGSNPPKRLSNSSEDLHPIFSDDGEKIVFYRGEIKDNNNVCSINADGSREQSLVTNDWLTTLDRGTKAGPLAFIPGRHQLLFNTYLCGEDLSPGCTVGLFLADTDTGRIKEVMPPGPSGYLPFGGWLPWRGNFSVSPDGKLLSVASAGHIDILDIDGEVIYRNVVSYTRTTPIELFPRVSWLPDSSGLIVALPAESNYGGGYDMTPTYNVWRYRFDGSAAVQVPLDQSPVWVYMECSDVMYISPDQNWIIFNRLEDDAQLFAGNLNNGHVQSYPVGIDCSPAHWNADSKHFVYGRLSGTFLGAVDKPLTPIDGNFLGWIDTTHFMYSHFPNQKEVLVGELGKEAITTYAPGIFLQEGYYPYSFTFVILDH